MTPSSQAIFSDYICPYAYLCLPEVRSLATQGFSVTRVASQLLHDVPAEGIPIAVYDRMRQNTPAIRERYDEMHAAHARERGLPWIKRTMICQSKPAHVFSKWAQALHLDSEAVHREIFVAEYGRGENIADRGVLQGVAERLGLDPSAVGAALTDERHLWAVERDLALQRSVVYLHQHVLSAERLTDDHGETLQLTVDSWLDHSQGEDWARLRTLVLPARLDVDDLARGSEFLAQWHAFAHANVPQDWFLRTYFGFVVNAPSHRRSVSPALSDVAPAA